MKTPKISVIMPFYDTHPLYLKKAVESVLGQTFGDFELILLNDSPENKKLDEVIWSFKDKRIKYLKSDYTLGVAEAHNTLLKVAKGKYIAIMDHDDISLPHRLEKQYAYMEAHKEVGICGTSYRRFGKLLKIKTIVHPQEHEKIKAALLFYCPLHHPSSMIRRALLEKFNIHYDKRFISLNDRKLYVDISKHARLHNLPDVLYKYRIHKKMTSKVHRNEIMKEQLRYRSFLLKRYGVRVSKEEEGILNTYIFNGRCRIKSEEILKKIELILNKLIRKNHQTHFADETALKELCGQYLIRRSKNAALKGFVSSRRILEKTALPIKCPLWLKVFNALRSRI